MYDILQLNDMLMPELLDAAEQLKIDGGKGLEKQDLIYKILDKQAVATVEDKVEQAVKKPRTKKVITVKATTANITEEAEVISEEKKEEVQEEKKRRKPREITVIKKAVSQEEDKTDNVNVNDTS